MGTQRARLLLPLLMALQVQFLCAAKQSGILLSEKGLVLNERSHPLVLAAGCSQVECLHSCKRNESCTATQYDPVNLICIIISCNEIEVTNKSGSEVSIKSITNTSLYFLKKSNTKIVYACTYRINVKLIAI